MTRKLLIYAICTILTLSACTTQTTPTNMPIAPTNTIPAAPTTPATAVIAPTSAAVPSATAASGAVEATQTAGPTLPPSSQWTDAPAAPITAQNAANLKPLTLTLPERADGLYWPGPNAQVPASLNLPNANLLAKSSSNVYGVTFNPPAASQAVTIPVRGRVITFSPDLSKVVARGSDGSMGVYSPEGKSLFSFAEDAPFFGSYSPDGSLIAVTSDSEFAISVYDVTAQKQAHKLTGFQTAAPVYGGGLIPGNQTAYWIARATVQFQNVQSGEMGAKLQFTDFVEALAFSPDGSRMALSVSGKVQLYSVPECELIAELTRSQPVNALAFSPDGKLLAAGYGTGIQFWDAASLSPVASLAGPNTFTGLISFSPDGQYLAAVHENNVISVWKVNP